MASGSLYFLSYNSSSPYGDVFTEKYSPGSLLQFKFEGFIIDASASAGFIMIVLANGTVWGIGVNFNGQLGTGDTTSKFVFT